MTAPTAHTPLGPRMPVRQALRRALPERLLAKLWAAKAGRRFRTTDGRILRVLYPGRPAPGHGPDFRDALLVLGGRRIRGPVELHRTPAEWRAHGHHRDAAYDGVVLHVVHEAEPAAPRLGLPTVVLDGDEGVSVAPAGAEPPLRALGCLGEDDLRAALRRAGLARFRARTERATAAVRENGIEQALYASALEALGYAENRAPFADLAERLPLRVLRQAAAAYPPALQGELLLELLRSCAGFAPAGRCEALEAEPMDPRRWRTAGVRPANHPLRRLEAAAELALESIPDGLRPLLQSACAGGAQVLVDALQLRRGPDGRPLVGVGRAREAAVGGVLPTLGAEAALRDDRRLATLVRGVYDRLPALPDNTITREARRLLGPGGTSMRLNACEHQGLMHLYRRAVA